MSTAKAPAAPSDRICEKITNKDFSVMTIPCIPYYCYPITTGNNYLYLQQNNGPSIHGNLHSPRRETIFTTGKGLWVGDWVT